MNKHSHNIISFCLDQHKWWTKSSSNADDSKSTNVEITSYGVLALLAANRTADAFPFFKWLLTQRNDCGGFVSTQDTVLGLQALSAYGQLLSTKDNDIQLKIQADTIDERTLVMSTDNSLVLQTIDLPSETNSVQITATGHGFCLFQLSYRYNVKGSDEHSAFTLTPNVLDTTAGFLNVQNCARCVAVCYSYQSNIFSCEFICSDSIQEPRTNSAQIW